MRGTPQSPVQIRPVQTGPAYLYADPEQEVWVAVNPTSQVTPIELRTLSAARHHHIDLMCHTSSDLSVTLPFSAKAATPWSFSRG